LIKAERTRGRRGYFEHSHQFVICIGSMKKVFKSKIFWTIITVAIIAGAFYFRLANNKKGVEYVTANVEKGNIVQTVSATGQVKSASEIDLNFKNTGQLAVLNVKVGNQVSSNQILAQLKATDLAIQVNRAQADLAEAQANLDKTKAGATAQDIAVSQAAVAKAETDLANAQADLANSKSTYSQALDNARANALVDANASLTKANISLQKVYDTLNYEGDSKNFTTANSGLRSQIDVDYDLSLTKADEAELAYNLGRLDSADEKVDSAVSLTLTALNQVSLALDNLAELLDYVILNSVLTQTKLDSLKTSINSERTTTDTSINTVEVAKQDLADARLNYQTKVEEANNAVRTAEKNLTKAQADLELKKAPARPEDISLYQARVIKARADLQLAQDKYNETIIKAPISGVITDINVDLGEQTSLSEPVIKMLATESYEIEVDIPESDIVKIDVADEAEITLDAFSSDDIFKGIVTTINPAQTEIQDVVYYRVTITFKNQQPANIQDLLDKIKPGMTANVTVKTDEVKDVLLIPLRAVKEKDGKKIVEILVNNQPVEVEVSLGLRGDEGLVEALSGLSEGQLVITFTRNGN